MNSPQVSVFGPAYLDRVLHVDGPLVDPQIGPPLDQSLDGALKFAESPSIEIVDPTRYTIKIALPADWPGPAGLIDVSRPIQAGITGNRSVRGTSWHDDLGGMGAGYAAALRGELCCASGRGDDPRSRAIISQLAAHGIVNEPIVVANHDADWTLLVSSGAFGDKLPIGFRGCHAAIDPDDLAAVAASRPCNLRVVASLPNTLAARALGAPGAKTCFFAPAMRNMLDRACPVSRFAKSIDILSCNRHEWETLEDREEVAWQLSILIVTDGPSGSSVRYTTTTGEARVLHVPAFPRRRPPRDTNRAGESYAGAMLATLLDAGWDAASGVIEDDLIRTAAARGSAAAALQLDRTRFGFPTADEIDQALIAGEIV